MKNRPAAVQSYKPIVLKSLRAYLEHHIQNHAGSLAWERDVAERLMTFATTGKLLRGSLVCYSYEVCGGKSLPASVLNAAIALELSHAALLIHDDIIDQDDRRRGRPAIHYQYRQLFRPQPMPAHPGNSMGICAGDMTLLMAFEALGTAANSLSALLARELMTVCAGQMQDVYATGSAERLTKRQIYALMQAKSAGYSVALPLMAGAVLAGRPATLQRQLYALGVAAGTMFQIRDDELGVLGQTDKLGKPVGADIREGKQTLLYYYLWQAVDLKERRRLAVIFGNPKASRTDIAAVQQMLLHYKIPDRLQTDLDRLERTASRHIRQLRLPQTRKQELHQLVQFCAKREV